MGRKSIMGESDRRACAESNLTSRLTECASAPTLPWTPTHANLEQAQKLNARIKAQIEAGTFVFSDTFPKFKRLRKLPGSVSAKSCNYEEFRFFTGLRPSEEIALTMKDYDRVNGVPSVTKARVDGIDKDCTKTGEDRRIKHCPRARAILERQLQMRARLKDQHGIQHEPHLFVTDDGRPIPDGKYPYPRWERTLKRLRIRYRRPYVARQTSVSWNLMMSRNPLLIAIEHGHRILTMLTVYAAWTEGAVEADFWGIQDAMYRTDLDTRRSRSVTPCFEPVGAETRVSIEHRAWDMIPRRHAARHGFPEQATLQRAGDWWRNSLHAFKERISGS